jgi:hypothetical protein
MLQSNLAFEIIHADAIFMPLVHLPLNYIISSAFWCVPQQKIETPTLVEFVSIKPYSSVDAHF